MLDTGCQGCSWRTHSGRRSQHLERYGPPVDQPWVISHEYEIEQCKELEEVWLKRYRKLLGNEHVENRLTYFDRKLWATAIEADCEVGGQFKFIFLGLALRCDKL